MGYETTMHLVTKCGRERSYINAGGKFVVLFEGSEDGVKFLEYYAADGGKKKLDPLLYRDIVKASNCIEIAMVDLCKTGGEVGRTGQEGNDYATLFASDGDTEILEDMYGDRLVFTDPKVVLKQLRKAIKKGGDKPYRRYVMAYALLKAAIDTFKADDLRVVFYGH